MSSLIAQYFLNHRLDPDEIEWQMEEFARQGYHGVYAHARAGLLTPYFSEAWWQALDKMIEVCKRTGLELWIWDEDYYPSGLCGGRVVWDDPGLVARQLEFTIQRVDGADGVEVDFAPGMLLRAFAIPAREDGTLGEPLDVTAHCGTRRQHWGGRHLRHGAYSPLINRIGHPHWRASIQENRFALMWQPPEPGPYVVCAATVQNMAGGRHPDLLRPEGIRRFIELSYEPYAKRYPDEMGSIIKGAFTDEPSPGARLFPWTARFPDEFAADHGYDLLAHLPHLALDIDGRSPAVRHHYRLTQHRLQKANYVEQVARWCEAHGIAMVGHLTRTEWLSLVAAWWPNELRCYEPMAIPSCDPLGASEGWADAAAYHTGLKVASSAAHLFSREQAGSDCVAVIGDEASLRDLKYHFDYQMAMGINHFSVHGLSYSLDGPRKDEVPPSIFYQHTQWKHMGTLLGHVSRTAAELTGGRHLCELAVLYPSTSLACQLTPDADCSRLPDEERIHALSELLLSHQRDFDFIDEVAVQQQVDADGALHTPEPYTTILLPHLRFIDARTADGLLRFARGGGRVLAIGTMPRAIAADLAEPVRGWADDAIEFRESLDGEALANLPGIEVAGDGACDVFVLQREKGGERRTLVFNRREAYFEGTVDGQAVTVAPRSSVLLKASEPDLSTVLPPAGSDALDISSGWRVAFGPNHVPLSYWHVAPWTEQPLAAFEPGEGFDLMRREADPAGDGESPVRYVCRFMLTGDIPDARLVIEDATIAGDWQVFVNGTRIDGWKRARVPDCRNLEAPAAHALRGGSTPTLNLAVVETRGPGRGLHEIPYLYGSFTCEYRYGHLSFPFLSGGARDGKLDVLEPWDVLGYPTFSGSAAYTRRLEIAEAGDYLLDLGRVEDCAAVSVDGVPVAVLPWEPYRCVLRDLARGAHTLAVEVTNPPANRTRAAGLPAGLLGPVKLGSGAAWRPTRRAMSAV